MEMELLPLRWPRRQEDSLEAGEGDVAGLGMRAGGSIWVSSLGWSKRVRRGDWKRCLSGAGERNPEGESCVY
jgi:hypothetical protein